jgi:hypothetical protein
MRSGIGSNGRRPDDVANDPVARVGPIVLTLHEELFELIDRLSVLFQLAPRRAQMLRRPRSDNAIAHRPLL